MRRGEPWLLLLLVCLLWLLCCGGGSTVDYLGEDEEVYRRCLFLCRRQCRLCLGRGFSRVRCLFVTNMNNSSVRGAKGTQHTHAGREPARKWGAGWKHVRECTYSTTAHARTARATHVVFFITGESELFHHLIQHLPESTSARVLSQQLKNTVSLLGTNRRRFPQSSVGPAPLEAPCRSRQATVHGTSSCEGTGVENCACLA